jgi:hypothetical protein
MGWGTRRISWLACLLNQSKNEEASVFLLTDEAGIQSVNLSGKIYPWHVLNLPENKGISASIIRGTVLVMKMLRAMAEKVGMDGVD